MAFRKDAYQKVEGVNTGLNFSSDTDLCLRVKKEGKAVFLPANSVITSSRHFRGREGLKYALKGFINTISLMLFKEVPFFHFGDVRKE